MKSYTGYLIASYTTVFVCLGILFWMNLKQSRMIKKQLLKNWIDLNQ